MSFIPEIKITGSYRRIPWMIPGLLLLSFIPASTKVNQLSIDVRIKQLHKNKVIKAKATKYYQSKDSKLVTHFQKPRNMLIITNKDGAMKYYDVKNNKLMQKRGISYSSRHSLIYHFISGQTEYMGFKEEGFKVADTRTQDNLFITEFEPTRENGNPQVNKAELVHKKHDPVFMGYYNEQGKPLQKIYFTDFKRVANIRIPLKITEFQYVGKNDSIITRRHFSNITLNQAVEDSLFDFKIPEDAEVVDK